MTGLDRDFDGLDLKGEVIVDENGKKLGKVLTSQFNVGVALIDLNRLNTNGPNHAYQLSGYRALLWQPTWLDMQLSAEKEEEEGEAEPEEADIEVNEGSTKNDDGIPTDFKK